MIRRFHIKIELELAVQGRLHRGRVAPLLRALRLVEERHESSVVRKGSRVTAVQLLLSLSNFLSFFSSLAFTFDSLSPLFAHFSFTDVFHVFSFFNPP